MEKKWKIFELVEINVTDNWDLLDKSISVRQAWDMEFLDREDAIEWLRQNKSELQSGTEFVIDQVITIK